jgi:4-amino-4-deoxy-L-arabinose transferase-like glycosyltransferase
VSTSAQASAENSVNVEGQAVRRPDVVADDTTRPEVDMCVDDTVVLYGDATIGDTAELPGNFDLSRADANGAHPNGAVSMSTQDTSALRTARRRLHWAALAPVLLTAAITTVLAWNITGFPAATDDEGTYLAQAWAVQHGVGLAHYTYWYDHPPLAWIQLAALSWLPALVLPQALAVGVGRLAMLPVSIACLLLVYVLGRRLGMSRWASCLALALYGLAPISVTMVRQIYLDEFAVAWILVAFVLARSPRRHLWHYVAAGAAAAVAVLCKETMLVAVPGVLVALWQGTARTPLRPWAVVGFTAGLSVVGAFYPLYAVLKGEFLPGPGHVSLVGAWLFQLNRPGSGSMLTPGSGSNLLLQSWLYYDSVLIVGGLAAGLVALAFRHLRGPAMAVVLLATVALRPGGYLPAMYIIQLLPLLALVLAGVAETGVDRLPRSRVRLRWSVLVITVIVASAYVVPRWYGGDERALTTNANAFYDAAAVYLRQAVPGRADTTMVVDDVLWLDLVRAGYPRDQVLWFYKVDLDPAVSAQLTHGWRDVDVIVSTPVIRQDTKDLPTIRALLTHSTVVATFGAGDGRIEIRRVNKEEP